LPDCARTARRAGAVERRGLVGCIKRARADDPPPEVERRRSTANNPPKSIRAPERFSRPLAVDHFVAVLAARRSPSATISPPTQRILRAWARRFGKNELAPVIVTGVALMPQPSTPRARRVEHVEAGIAHPLPPSRPGGLIADGAGEVGDWLSTRPGGFHRPGVHDQRVGLGPCSRSGHP